MWLRQGLDHMLADKNIRRPLNLVAHGFITGGAQRRPRRPPHSPTPGRAVVACTRHTAQPQRPVCSGRGSSLCIPAEDTHFRCASKAGSACSAGQYAATWALKHPEAVSKLVLIDMPLDREVRLVPSRDSPPRLLCCRAPLLGCDMSCGVWRECGLSVWGHWRFPAAKEGPRRAQAKLPGRLQLLRVPFAGAMACQVRVPACLSGPPVGLPVRIADWLVGCLADPRAVTPERWSMDLRQPPRVAAPRHSGPAPLPSGARAMRLAREQRIAPRCTICNCAPPHQSPDT